MAGYTHEYSNFPESVLSLEPIFKDIDSVETYNLVVELQQAKISKDYSKVTQLLENHPELVDYIIGALTVNTMVEEIRNTQILAKSAQQNIYIGNRPEITQYGDIRIGQPSSV